MLFFVINKRKYGFCFLFFVKEEYLIEWNQESIGQRFIARCRDCRSECENQKKRKALYCEKVTSQLGVYFFIFLSFILFNGCTIDLNPYAQ